MTEENFFVGIGGTGSRVLEAFVHCCAAGFGPKGKVNLVLIDPDKANGNLERTRKLVGDYCALWAKISPELEADNPAFRTELVVPEAGLVWGIFDEQSAGKTLASYIGYDGLKREQPALADAANLLFTQQELTTPLDEGFRGHPAIGAVVMANPPFYDTKLPLSILTASAGPEKSARVFIVGSIFGGTGAAGFPTIGKVLHKQLSVAWGGKLLLGGALVLPYFHVPPHVAKPGEKMFVTSSNFPAATKAALRYYDENELKFDQYYFVGDSVPQEVGEFAAGAGKQENDPHYVELVTALAGLDFFDQKPVAPGADKQYFVAGRNAETVSWDDLPIAREGGDPERLTREFREDIGAFTVFCYTYLTYGLDHLRGIRRQDKIILNSTPWIRDTFDDFKADNFKKNPGHDDNRELLDNRVAGYAHSFLSWVTGLAGNERRDNGRNVKLIDRAMLLDRNASSRDAQGLPRLPLITPPANNLGQLLHGYPSQKNLNSFVTEGLNALAVKNSPKDASYRFLNLFFRASRWFVGAAPAATAQR